MSTSEMSALVGRLEAVTSRLEGLAAKGTGGGPAVDVAEFVDEYDSQVRNGKLKKYLSLSAELGGDIAEHARMVRSAFHTQLQFIKVCGSHKTPALDVVQNLLKPQSSGVNQVVGYCDKRRGSKVFNHLMTVKEGIGCIGWVTVAPKPVKYVKEMHDQALFYGNRVIKEYKGKEDKHVEWVRAFTGAILELKAYVESYHTTGVQWNAEGGIYSPPPPGGASAPPPPPPPAVVPPTGAPPPSGGSQEAARSALFSDISQGGNVTKGLRKVTDEMKTHKNPALRGSSVVKASEVKSSAPPKAGPKFGAAPTKKKPVCELQGKKWVVEFQEDNPNVVLTDTNPKQNVYVYKCTKTTIKVSGKLNSIIIDSCKRVALVFDDVISSVEVINSQSIQVQVLGKCPTVSIDKTDGCQVYLSTASLRAEIVTAKSSEMNICIPTGTAGDYSEHALPEQFKTVWNGKTLVTESSDINQ